MLFLLGIFFSCSPKLYVKGNEAYQQKDYDNAIKYFEKFIEENPDDELIKDAKIKIKKSYYQIGIQLYNQKRYMDAIGYFKISKYNNYREMIFKSYKNYAKDLFKDEKYEEAIDIADRILNEFPENEKYKFESLIMQFRIYYKMNDENGYLSILDKLKDFNLSEFPEDIQKYINELKEKYKKESKALIKKAKFEDGIKKLEILLSFPGDKKEINKLIGNYYFKAGKYYLKKKNLDKIYENFSNAIKYDENLYPKIEKEAKKYLKRGDRYKKRKKYTKAIREYEIAKAIISGKEEEINQKIGECYYLLAKSYLRRKKYDKAEEYNQKAILLGYEEAGQLKEEIIEKKESAENTMYSGKYYTIERNYLNNWVLIIDAPTKKAAINALLKGLRKFHNSEYMKTLREAIYGKNSKVIIKYLGSKTSSDGLAVRVKIRIYVIDRFGEFRAGNDEYEYGIIDIDKKDGRWKLRLNLSLSLNY